MLGFLDSFNPTISGWLFCELNPDLIPIISVILDDVCIFQVTADLPRHDVSQRIGPYNRGFSVDINEHTTPNRSHTLRVVAFSPEFHDFGTYQIIGFSKVEFGKGKWLFLVNDSNHTDLKIQSDSSLFEDDIIKNVNQFKCRQDFFLRNNFKNLSVIIPERSLICNEYRTFPLNISESRPAVILFDKIKSNNIINFSYPINLFLSNRDVVFCKTDTHLSFFGYFILFDHIFQYFDDFNNPLNDFLLVDNYAFKGDLSIHFASDVFERVVEIDPACYSEIIFDDPLGDLLDSKRRFTGTVVTSYNPNAKLGKVFISGTSSAYYSVRLFSLIFKEVFFEWNNGIDYKKIVDFGPDLFLWLGIERFLPFHDPDKNTNT
jgi:hypothetical protein